MDSVAEQFLVKMVTELAMQAYALKVMKLLMKKLSRIFDNKSIDKVGQCSLPYLIRKSYE